MKVARIYLRVSSEDQDLKRQERIIDEAKNFGYYIGGIYKETASGARPDRPELIRMINDLQKGDVVIAEKIDRISRLPLDEAEKLIQTIRGKGAVLAIPNIIDLSQLIETSEGVSKVILEGTQELLLKISLQIARDDYEDRRKRQKEGIALAKAKGKYSGRKPNKNKHELILKLRKNHTIKETAQLASCSESLVKLVSKNSIHEKEHKNGLVDE